MKLHYSLDSAIVLDAERGPATLVMLRNAGVNTIWLYGFFFGKLWSPIKDMVQAAEVLRENGFEVGVIQLPVGHPGNGLNPDDDTLDLQIPEHWRYRVNAEGQLVYYCAAIEENMIRDNIQSINELKSAGFTRFFMDDDLRSGLWGERLSGCFSEQSIAEFNKAYHRNVDRLTLVGALDNNRDIQLLKEWMEYNCDKLTGFMEAMALPDNEVGIMVMHLGDERQGIDVDAIKRRIPDCLFRVGEFHFGDSNFGTPEGKASEWFSILYHLDVMGREHAYSETTIFPARALSPENFIFKAKLALMAGIPNLLFMSGTWLITEEYWQRLGEELPALEELEKTCSISEREYPIHMVYGTKGYAEEVAPYLLPILAGLPVKPVRVSDGEGSAFSGADCLLFFGDYELTSEWERRFPFYRTILMDQTAHERNKDKIAALDSIKVDIWDYAIGAAASAGELELLRGKLLEQGALPYPILTEGSNISLTWFKEANCVLLVNLEDKPNSTTLSYGDIERNIALKPLEIIQQSLV